MKTSATLIVTRSSREPVLIAEIMPIGIPTASQMTTAPPVRKIVAGMRLRICGSTAWLDWNE
jgi:hypothetical protein